jgi:hypothetical protein
VDLPLTEKVDVFGFQPLFNGQTLEIHSKDLQLKNQCHQFHFAQQVTIKMGTETALLHKFQIFALQDMKVMDREVVSKLIMVYLLFHHFVQLEIIMILKETVFQIKQ